MTFQPDEPSRGDASLYLLAYKAFEDEALGRYAEKFPDGPQPAKGSTDYDHPYVRLHNCNGLLATYAIKGDHLEYDEALTAVEASDGADGDFPEEEIAERLHQLGE